MSSTIKGSSNSGMDRDFLTTIQPHNSKLGIGSDQVLVSIPCCVEVPEGGSMFIDSRSGSSTVALGAVVFFCDTSMEPDAAEISVLTGCRWVWDTQVQTCAGS